MRSGELRHRVLFQQNIPVVNLIGEYIDTYSDYMTVWGAVEPDTGSTMYSAKQLNAEADGKIRIRYFDGLDVTMRISWDGRYFRILSFYRPQEKKDQIIILYKEALD